MFTTILIVLAFLGGLYLGRYLEKKKQSFTGLFKKIVGDDEAQ